MHLRAQQGMKSVCWSTSLPTRMECLMLNCCALLADTAEFSCGLLGTEELWHSQIWLLLESNGLHSRQKRDSGDCCVCFSRSSFKSGYCWISPVNVPLETVNWLLWLWKFLLPSSAELLFWHCNHLLFYYPITTGELSINMVSSVCLAQTKRHVNPDCVWCFKLTC